MIGLYIIGAVFAFLGMIVSGRLKSKFKKYSELHLQNNMSGKEIAELMLQQNGITDVQVIHVKGQLTDHYNPINKTVNLSEAVYHQRSAAAAAVAAHECGHAVQHADSYHWITMRSKLVPFVNISAKALNIGNIILLMGAGFLAYLGDGAYSTFLYVLIAANIFLTLFAFVTLPVEFDASKRALAWIQDNNIVTQSEYDGAKDALKWAALTYVVAALGALANLLYYLSLLLNRR